MARDKERGVSDLLQTVAGDRGLQVRLHREVEAMDHGGSQLLVRAAIGRVNAEGYERLATQALAFARPLLSEFQASPVGRHANSTEPTHIRPGSHWHRLLDIAQQRPALPGALGPVRGFVLPFFASGGGGTNPHQRDVTSRVSARASSTESR